MGINAIISEGKKEWRRRRSIRKENSALKDKQSILSERTTLMGEKAWGEGVGIDNFAEIKKNLTTHQTELDALKKKSEDGLKKKADLENRKVKAEERFTAERQGVEEKKKAVDSRLDTEKEQLKTLKKSLAQSESRSRKIADERSTLQKKIIDTDTSEEMRLSHQTRLDELATEEAELLEVRKEQSEAVKIQDGRIEPVQKESDQLNDQIDDILDRRKKEIGEIDKAVKEIQGELDGRRAREKEVEADRKKQFSLLGEKLAAEGTTIPTLETELTAVRETEKEIAQIQAEIAGLDGQQNEASSSAYRKMMTIIVGGVLLLVALIILAVMLLSPKKSSPLDAVAEGKTPTTSYAEAVARSSSQSTEQSDSTESKESTVAIPEGMETFADSMKAVGEASREKIGKDTPVASEENLSAALTEIPGSEMSNPTFSKAEFSNIETATLRTTYRNSANQPVEVEITDTHSLSILLMPYQSMMAMERTVDNDKIYQKTGRHMGFPLIETLDKENGEARLVLIVKERYILSLETEGEGGLERLRSCMSALNPGALK